MFRPYTLAELTGLTEEQLIAAHDVAVGQTIVGAEYYLEEIRNRRQSRVAASVEKLTRRIWWLTLCVTVVTIVNVGVMVVNLTW